MKDEKIIPQITFGEDIEDLIGRGLGAGVKKSYKYLRGYKHNEKKNTFISISFSNG